MDDIQKLKIISKYLPYKLGIAFTVPEEMSVKDDPDFSGELMGLIYTSGQISAQYRTFDDTVQLASLEDFKPMLRPFRLLEHTIDFRGKQVVPAIELAKLLLDLSEDDLSSIKDTLIIPGSGDCINVVFRYGEKITQRGIGGYEHEFSVFFWLDGFLNEECMFIGTVSTSGDDSRDTTPKNLLYVFDLLYEMRFAVGVPRHAYHELTT